MGQNFLGTQYLESLAALDGAENPKDGEVGQVRLVAAHERSSLLLDPLHPVVALVVQRLSHIVLNRKKILCLNFLIDHIHCDLSIIYHENDFAFNETNLQGYRKPAQI